jgi:6-pyruvoyltetrahydropterin/6-carboxytetrahydropterin synthase
MIISKEFVFDSAHKLDWHRGKCKNLHGHTYKLQVSVKGNLSEQGIVIDFADLDKIVKEKVIEILDHRLLNEIIPNPTAENLSIWIWDKLKDNLKGLCEIKLWETPKSFAVYSGEEK